MFLVSGRGWGHGVGMSQYGAYGQAQAPDLRRRILSHYYSGTTIGKAGRKVVRVLLAEGRQAVTISSTVPYTAVDATGAASSSRRCTDAALGPRAVPEGGSAPDAGERAARHPARQEGGPALDGKPYRGKLELVPQGAFFRVVNVVPLENYLQGVVAGEVRSAGRPRCSRHRRLRRARMRWRIS